MHKDNNPERPWHRLSAVDAEAKTAVCVVCGPVSIRIRPRGRGAECQTVRRRHREGTPTPEKLARKKARYAKTQFELSQKRSGWVGEMDAEKYAAMLQAQGGGCAICSSRPDHKRLSIDHDHASGAIRGLLCTACNWALGQFKDDPERFIAAAEYLRSAA